MIGPCGIYKVWDENTNNLDSGNSLYDMHYLSVNFSSMTALYDDVGVDQNKLS